MKPYDNGTFAPRHFVSEWEDNVVFDADDPDFSVGGTGAANVLMRSTTGSQQLARQLVSSNMTRSVTTYYGLNSASVVSNLNQLMKVSSSAKLSAISNSSSMSVASVQAPHLADLCSSLSRTSLSMSSSLSDLVGSPSLGAVFDFHSSDAVLTIEELREQLGSCYTCGVSWTEDQVSLDCSECGGYSLERPCLICEGICGQLWKRDFTMSHACGKSRWQGVCTKFPAQMIQLQSSAPLSSCASFGSHHQLTGCAAAANNGASTASQQHFLQQELCARLEKLSANAHS
ncbi:protein pinocchio [Anopheles marshallii]|uniref:protein pinocchio n=1 Tax=Anopheles marshallii TaxID=1521116 RepID=UPI00237BB31B|nr:protein pinocchio [Anopheles marshallii]